MSSKNEPYLSTEASCRSTNKYLRDRKESDQTGGMVLLLELNAVNDDAVMCRAIGFGEYMMVYLVGVVKRS